MELSLAGADLLALKPARSAPGGPVMIEAVAEGFVGAGASVRWLRGRGTSKFARKVAIRRKVSVKDRFIFAFSFSQLSHCEN